ncbi:MAG: 16S rRNA (adenine(1518)-N(6)/adenine(1519)-N(6))-dimethyltransferase RsmA [Acutalibacteraceae bacterium]
MLVTISPKDDKPELVSHGGQEFNYVLSGKVAVVLGAKTILLNEGDSVYFDPRIRHGQYAVDGEARFLTVIDKNDAGEFPQEEKHGQNFLVGDTVVRKIVAGSGITADCGVLEIGPGAGALTKELLGAAGRVLSVEIDDELIPVLQSRFGSDDRFRLIHGDILKTDVAALLREHFDGMPVCVCANLPYYITTPILMLLLEGRFGFHSITVMVQKEVAARLCAGKDDDCRGAITLAVQYYASVRRLFGVPAGCFSPPPKVDSAVVRMDPYPVPPVDTGDEKLFFTLIRAAFAQRRKTLLNALSAVFGGRADKTRLAAVLAEAGLAPDIRGEKLGIENSPSLRKK